MTQEFPRKKDWKPADSTLQIRLDMTFDVPEEIAEQLELWGLHTFQECEYDEEHQRLRMSAQTALYQKGA